MFTYDKEANKNTVHITRQEGEPPRKKLRSSRERALNFSDMTIFDDEVFAEAYDSCTSMTLYTDDIDKTQEWLREKNYEFHRRYRTVNTVASLRVPLRKRKRGENDSSILIKTVPTRATYLDALCKAFEAKLSLIHI